MYLRSAAKSYSNHGVPAPAPKHMAFVTSNTVSITNELVQSVNLVQVLSDSRQTPVYTKAKLHTPKI